MMFNFLFNFLFNEPQLVARNEYSWGFISTVGVNDGQYPYETAISHKDYNAGEIIVVEAYEFFEHASQGHNKWVDTMLNNLPEYLEDCGNSYISLLRDIAAGNPTRFYKNIKNID